VLRCRKDGLAVFYGGGDGVFEGSAKPSSQQRGGLGGAYEVALVLVLAEEGHVGHPHDPARLGLLEQSLEGFNGFRIYARFNQD
jgi:hypothetical protein